MFITLEGIEGAGKTTQLPRLVDFLEQHGHTCVVTREPGGTGMGQKIRSLLLDPDNSDMSPETELFLYAADRAQHVRRLIEPALAEGKTVVCDRFADATEVYQGWARGLDMELVQVLNRVATGGRKPDITLLFDLPPEAGLKRAWQRIARNGKEAADCRFENEKMAFHERVRHGYLDLARREPERFVVIDALGPAAEVAGRMIAALERVPDINRP
ncbi:dTMP kinase [Desulfosudis oleivorans]|uniref:Thymidylate kinase n=1 Tax=Desulfosudis oleivorans (strain DSM 6200 / JCM 39069 / Hxd3) TaxID=96561 RepID=KTHY_DESOH|nr:dTMP kinase [Desulfosudis oleivorans]A8ZXL3.1 RecName: Full=Thymidylate kinase; AltName: Full=dTMP kinase [Desulfosudis oleivorans Hxd3]ABW66971.1 dTMP kinase [Desulfosudis oleivorans Hxd3]